MIDRLSRYWVHRRGTWLESVMVEAESPDAAMKLAKKIPDAVFAQSRILTEDRPRRKTPFFLGGVSLSDDREPWNPDDPVPDTPLEQNAGFFAAQFDSELYYSGAEVKRRIEMMAHAAAPHVKGEPCAVCDDDDKVDV